MASVADRDDGRRLSGLDHLRAFAIAYVFILHYSSLFAHPRWLESLASFGWSGVDLFFVLSGYLIAAPLLRAMASGGRIALREFYIKRSLRILPAYLVSVALYFTVPGAREFDGLQPLWKFLTFSMNLGFDGALGRAFSHAWSLCIEEHFYLVLPLLLTLLGAWRIGRHAWWLIAALGLGGVALRTGLWESLVGSSAAYEAWYRWIYYPTYARLDGLLVGVCAAATQCFAPAAWSRLTRRPGVLIVGGLALLAAASWLCEDRLGLIASAFSFPLIALGYGLLLLAAVSPAGTLDRHALRSTSWLAGISYSLYLIHKLAINVTQGYLAQRHIDPGGSLALLACIATSLAAASLMRACVEQPFLRWRARWLASGSARVVPAREPRALE